MGSSQRSLADCVNGWNGNIYADLIGHSSWKVDQFFFFGGSNATKFKGLKCNTD